MTPTPRDQMGVMHRLAGRPSLTAEAVALARAVERLRPKEERVVDDPYARLFLGRRGRGALAAWSLNGPATRLVMRLSPGGVSYIACRHRYLDDQLVAALDRGVEQVLILGAGYDSRAYRFADQLDGRPVFEVDLAAISQRKAAVIAANAKNLPTPDVRRVEIDFETETLPDVLATADFQTGAPTFVVWEGVCMYLTRATVKSTLGAVHELCGPDTGLGMDCWHMVDDPGLVGTARRMAPAALSLIGEAVTFGVHPEEMHCFLAPLGFVIVDLAMSDDLEARYSPDRPVDASNYLLTLMRADEP